MNPADPFLPTALLFLMFQAPLVLCGGWLAPKMGARRWLWIILTAIPWIGLLLGYALFFRAFGAVLDALNKRNQLLQDQHLERRLGMGFAAAE